MSPGEAPARDLEGDVQEGDADESPHLVSSQKSWIWCIRSRKIKQQDQLLTTSGTGVGMLSEKDMAAHQAGNSF